MLFRSLLNALHLAERLKNITRHCDTSGGRRESVAEHSWRLALLAYWMHDDFPELDIQKVIRMCLIHDLGEAFTGDIPSFDKTREDEAREEALLLDWVRTLPEPFATEMAALYREMATLKVVGFRDRRIGRLLISQNLWLTVLGILIGIPLGAAVLQYLIVSLAGEYELKLSISFATYLFSILLTFGVSLIVGLMVARRNKRIDMVAALKTEE